MSAPGWSFDDWLVISTGPGLFGFSVLVNEIRTNSRMDGAETVEQERRLQRHDRVLAVQVRVDGLGCLRLLGAGGLEGQAVDREREPQRGLALEHERDAADGLDRARRC